MCFPVCGMVHIKEALLLIGKSSPCGGSGFLSRYLNGPLPNNRKEKETAIHQSNVLVIIRRKEGRKCFI